MADDPVTVRGLLLDLDGVVTDTAESHLAAWRRIAEDEGLDVPDHLEDALRGRSREDSLRLILAGRSCDDVRFAELLARKNDLYLERLADLGPDDILPGALRLVTDARARGLAVAIASASRNARTILAHLGISDIFDAIVDGTMVAEAKPAPDVFVRAAAELGLSPAECVVVEDASAGIEAARRAGMRVVGVGPRERVGGADVRVDTVADLDLAAVLVTLEARG